MISVVIPLYNKEEYIKRTIESVLSQTFQDFEIIVVNDGSTDNSARIVETISDSRIHLVCQNNMGVSVARNRGVEESSFEYIAFLDADDKWCDNHLEIIVGLINKYPECGVFGTSYFFSRNNEIFFTPNVYGNYTFDGDDGVLTNYYEIASGADFPIHQSSYAVKKDFFKKIGGFPVGIVSGEDIITLAKLHAVCDFAYSKIPSSFFYLITEGKNKRPVKKYNPLDKEFELLLTTASHRKGVRRFVSSWHKRRMVSAIIMAHDYALAFREFVKAMYIYPFQKKLYSALLVSLISLITKKDLYTINKVLKNK